MTQAPLHSDVLAAQETRGLSPGAVVALEPFFGSGLLENGQINLISLDAIASRMGARWAMRSELVYEFTQRLLERHVGETGFFLRVSETDFLVVLPTEGKFAAKMRCIHYLREVLTHFLGEARSIDVTIREVTSITREGLEAVLVDPGHVEVAAEAEVPFEAKSEELLVSVDRWTPFVASDGRTVRVSCAVEPVFELKNFERIGNRISRRVIYSDTEEILTAEKMQRLSRGDLEKIDLATIARGLERLRAESVNERPLSVIIPVSFVTLSHQQGRASVAALFDEAKSLVLTGVICEVCDIENVPQPALLTATSLVKQHCMFVIGRLSGAPDHRLSYLSAAGIHALSFEEPPGIAGEAEFVGWAKAAIGAAKLVVKSVLIYRLSQPRHAGLAALLGSSHASLRSGAT